MILEEKGLTLDLSTHPMVQSFLAQAREDPHDDATRLILADWLEDHGDAPRAEFIRLGCRLAGSPELPHPEREALQARHDHLSSRHGGGWLGGLWQWWLSPLSWQRGLLSVGLNRHIPLEVCADVLPWMDTVLYTITGRESLLYLGRLLERGQFNHLSLDLRQPMRESLLLELLATLPECPCLRTLSIDWPLRLLHRKEESVSVPTVSKDFLSCLLGEIPIARDLTHLGSSPMWSREQGGWIRSLGVEPACADARLWMHRVSARCFKKRKSLMSALS